MSASVTPANEPDRADVIVVGGGNAGFCAAHAAAQRRCSVVLLEKGQEDAAGGNSYFTAGATRISHGGLADLLNLVEPDARHAHADIPPYSQREYLADIERVTDGGSDLRLARILVDEAAGTLRWLHGLGMRYQLLYDRQAYRGDDGVWRFWGGLHIGNVGGGVGLIDDHTRIARRLGTKVWYGSTVTDLLVEEGRVVGVSGVRAGSLFSLKARSVVLAAGGFESNPTMRRQFLGEGWQHAVVRGTPHNTGEALLAALRIGAAKGGDWSSAHSVQWDAWYEHNESNRFVTHRLTRQSYPLGIIVNSSGQRFVDEGEDYRNYTYAKCGRLVLEQPGGIAFQIFDQALRPLLRPEEYDLPGVSVVQADTLEALAEGLGVDGAGLVHTVRSFNGAVDETRPFQPAVKDGRRANTTPPKSNWSMPIATPPFYGYPVTCGITFTFGGLKADVHARVFGTDDRPIPGLYVCGEMLGGLFRNNYPGGAGLAAGMVFGRRAGRDA